MNKVSVSKLALFYCDQEAFLKTKGIVKETAAVKHGIKAHNKIGKRSFVLRLLFVIVGGVICYLYFSA
ncbi:hypothetical protein [uncultured Pseudoalteromonas sp.]|uniref:hypothetical protein n=1 Tax=uncultured Pseudoalteromonas sp. TaxID=114053 RepID=UPI00259A56CD|nr:hypothetical protein [uncultured Pseudoalteromonas sp.]